VSGAGPGGQENHRYGSGYQEVAPRIPRGGPHHECGVALNSKPYAFWVTGAKRMQSRYLEVAPRIPRGGLNHVCGVALSSTRHSSGCRHKRCDTGSKSGVRYQLPSD